MLNISENSIIQKIDVKAYKSFDFIQRSKSKRAAIWPFISLLVIFVLCVFLPWTQNIGSKGYVTTLSPEQRPQAIQSIIGGRIEKWYIQEGDLVDVGDTIAHISEVKTDYFDPDLIRNTEGQLDVKNQSVQFYLEKTSALETQLVTLKKALNLKKAQWKNKIRQINNKIEIDSIDLEAYKLGLSISEDQKRRIGNLYRNGLKSKTDLQEKEAKNQQALAKVNVQKNKLVNSKRELENAEIELLTVEQDYLNKMAKIRSDIQSAKTYEMEGRASALKLKNKLTNYKERKTFYFITAPQSGYITKTIRKGLGEIIKDGAELATIVPDNYTLAADVYVKPQDIPLIKIGDVVQLKFDGWPAIVISGWPETSTGVFQGEIVAIDRYIGDNGLYRVMVSESESTRKWPKQLSIGTGLNAFILLNEVPIWYEVWRQLNAFPPDFYRNKDHSSKVKLKAPLKSVK